MKYDNTQYEESIDLLGLAAGILRKRWWLVMACLAGALVLGLYKGVLRPGDSGNAAEIAKLQEEIDTSTETLTKNEDEIATNGTTIAANQEKIAANDELLVTQQALQATLQNNLTALQTTLEQSQAVLADPNASSERTAEVIVQLLNLTNDITELDGQLNTAATRVNNTKKDTTNLQADIDKMTASNEKLEAANAELRTAISEKRTQVEKLNSSGGLMQIVKYAVMGAVLGAFVFCGIVFLKYFRDKTLRNSAELKEKYDLPILGEFCSAAALKHSKFEKKLDQLSGDVQTHPEKRQVYDLIAAGIQASGEDLPMRLAVTGTVDKEILREVSGWLCKFLPEEYEVLMASNPVYNPGFLAELRQYTILLVEVKKSSDKREIDKLAEVLCRNEVKVVGAVVL